jgi:hypothetical protein
MSKEQTTSVAQAEAAAQEKQAAEEVAQKHFEAVRARIEGAGTGEPTETDEFKKWMSARHASDEAWGKWAMAMDAAAA